MDQNNIFYNFLKLIENTSFCTQIAYIENLLKYNILELGTIQPQVVKTTLTDYCLKQLYTPNTQKKITSFGTSNLLTGLIKN